MSCQACSGAIVSFLSGTGSYFETDRRGTNSIINVMKGDTNDHRDIKMSAGYESVIDWA